MTPVNVAQARAKCEREGGQLATAYTDMHVFFQGTMHSHYQSVLGGPESVMLALPFESNENCMMISAWLAVTYRPCSVIGVPICKMDDNNFF